MLDRRACRKTKRSCYDEQKLVIFTPDVDQINIVENVQRHQVDHCMLVRLLRNILHAHDDRTQRRTFFELRTSMLYYFFFFSHLLNDNFCQAQIML
jgi:hypothetical protein